jgi:hypothetical protein
MPHQLPSEALEFAGNFSRTAGWGRRQPDWLRNLPTADGKIPAVPKSRRLAQAAPFFSAGGSTRSTSTVHSFSAAAIAPTAASTGANHAHSERKLHDRVSVVFDDDAADISFVKQPSHGIDQLLSGDFE